MNILGVIVEYNPFHNGHIYHLQKSKEITNSLYTVAVMSGNFTQRGDIAILDKFKRANIAVENGVDLVLELPTIYATSSSDYFAFGAINLLNSLNTINSICFGATKTSILELKNLATILIDKKDLLNSSIISLQKEGISYPKARQEAISKFIQVDDNMFDSNNILATHYIENILKLNSPIVPYITERVSNSYTSTILSKSSSISSATSLRNALQNSTSILDIKKYIPLETYNSLSNDCYIFNDSFFDILRYNIISNKENISNISGVVEGLENKIYSAALISTNYIDLVANIKSKRYTQSKIQRILINILLNITKDMLYDAVDKKVAYARVLAMNENGKKILSNITKNSNISVITKLNNITIQNLDDDIRNYLNLDIFATNVFDICKKNTLNNDYYNKL